MVRRFSRSLDVLQDVFAYVEEALQAQAAGRLDVREIQLVVEELFTNCLRHNQGGTHDVEVGIERRDERLVLEIVDHDVPPFDVTQVPALSSDKPLSERRGGGMGLQLVQSICDDLRYEYDDGTSRIIAEKQLGAEDV